MESIQMSLPRWRLRSTSEQPADLEKSGALDLVASTIPSSDEPQSKSSGDQCSAALVAFFGLSEEQIRVWPGIQIYCRHLESAFSTILTPNADVQASNASHDHESARAEPMAWSWLAALATATREFRQSDLSMQDILDRVLSGRPSDMPDVLKVQRPEGNSGINAVFASLCWGTLCLTPCLKSRTDGLSPILRVQEQQVELPVPLQVENTARRPIHAAFRNFPALIWTARWQQPIRPSSSEGVVSLTVAALNYACLRSIGRVRIKWVSSVSQHLEFDPRQRLLSVFRFPTFCVLKLIGQDQPVAAYEEVIRALYGAESHQNNHNSTFGLPIDAAVDFEYGTQIYQEILMSYRLIFGQTRGSRKCAKAELRRLGQEKGASRPAYDELLQLLCTQGFGPRFLKLPAAMWPVTCRSFNDTLQEESSYSPRDDFPLLGQRLVRLQEFNLRQQPSRLRDLWRDRRNPLQWYTFWAVVYVGGASILIGILQLVVGILQIVL